MTFPQKSLQLISTLAQKTIVSGIFPGASLGGRALMFVGRYAVDFAFKHPKAFFALSNLFLEFMAVEGIKQAKKNAGSFAKLASFVVPRRFLLWSSRAFGTSTTVATAANELKVAGIEKIILPDSPLLKNMFMGKPDHIIDYVKDTALNVIPISGSMPNSEIATAFVGSTAAKTVQSPLMQMVQQTPVEYKSEAISNIVASGHWYDWIFAHPYLIVGGILFTLTTILSFLIIIDPMNMYMIWTYGGIVGKILMTGLAYPLYFLILSPITKFKNYFNSSPPKIDLVDLRNVSVVNPIADYRMQIRNYIQKFIDEDKYLTNLFKESPKAKEIILSSVDVKTKTFDFSAHKQLLADDNELHLAVEMAVNYIAINREFVLPELKTYGSAISEVTTSSTTTTTYPSSEEFQKYVNELDSKTLSLPADSVSSVNGADVSSTIDQLGFPLPLFFIFPVISWSIMYFRAKKLLKYINTTIKK
jgi:hypothetical protein